MLYILLYFLIPGNVEQFLNYSNSVGNMGIYGIFLGIYNKRNLFYLSSLLFLLTYLFNYYYLSVFFIICTFFSLLLYIKTCFDWKFIFVNGKVCI
jgi:hypothetical protein